MEVKQLVDERVPTSEGNHTGRVVAWLAREFVRALATVDLSPPQYRILILLAGGSSLSSSLAARSAVSPPSVTSVVDGLVGRELVERQHGEDDRRKVALKLTPSGATLLAEADRAVDDRLATLASYLPREDETRALADLCLWGEAMSARNEHESPEDSASR